MQADTDSAAERHPRLARLNWLLVAQVGIDLRRIWRSLRGLPHYLRDLRRFRKGYSGPLECVPCLHDRYEEGGATRSEYFWQDLLVARRIHAAKPQVHVDIGSRVDGFVAHVAAFRDIQIFDVRPITTSIPGVSFRQADLMAPVTDLRGCCDSLSCLHALEHFGLGRYGDPLNPRGHERGLANMAVLLKTGGTFYLSTPIGVGRVEFNANRVFDPREILAQGRDNGLRLTDLTTVSAHGDVRTLGVPDHEALLRLARHRYLLGIFTFVKIAGTHPAGTPAHE